MATTRDPLATRALVERTAAPEGGEAVASRGIWRVILDVFLQNRLAVVGVGIVVFFLLFCFVGPLIYRTTQVVTNLTLIHLAPSSQHLLGTDADGYDELGRLMVGGQTSLEVGLAAAVVATLWGTLWGAVAGFVGGAVDAVMMRIVDSVLAIPPIFLLLFLATAFTPSVSMLIFVVAFVSWVIPARLVRGESLSLRSRDFILAVRGMGSRDRRLVLRHILPNAVGPMIVYATFAVADAILLVAALSFLGLGIPPPAANWGEMLSNGLNYIADGWWWLVYPAGLCIVLVVVAFNFIGDALRDAVEVRLQRR